MEAKGPWAEPACFHSGPLYPPSSPRGRICESHRLALKLPAWLTHSTAPAELRVLTVIRRSEILPVPFRSSRFSDLNHLHFAYNCPRFSDSRINILDFYSQTVLKVTSAGHQIRRCSGSRGEISLPGAPADHSAGKCSRCLSETQKSLFIALHLLLLAFASCWSPNLT